jgi:chromosome transmission fidelity protein 1
MLCAALYWLREAPKPSAQEAQEPSPAQSSSEPKWLQQMRLEREASKPVETHALVPSYTAKRPRIGGHKKLADIGLDAKIASLVRALDDEDSDAADIAESGPANNFGYQYRNRKVFYCSRTHSQLAQVMTELRKTTYFREQELALTVGSRKNLCINPKVVQAASFDAINDLCQETLESETGCPFYNRAKHAAFGEFLRFSEEQHSLDFEDMARMGRGSGCCSYFASRYLVNPASFVAVPYNTILDRRTRESYGIDLKDSVVIFDEAHNIVDFVSQMDSACLSDVSVVLGELSSSLSEYRSKFFSRLSGANNSSLSQLLLAVEGIRTHLKGSLSSARTYTVNEFLHAAQIDGINFVKLAEYIQESKLLRKVT